MEEELEEYLEQLKNLTHALKNIDSNGLKKYIAELDRVKVELEQSMNIKDTKKIIDELNFNQFGTTNKFLKDLVEQVQHTLKIDVNHLYTEKQYPPCASFRVEYTILDDVKIIYNYDLTTCTDHTNEIETHLYVNQLTDLCIDEHEHNDECQKEFNEFRNLLKKKVKTKKKIDDTFNLVFKIKDYMMELYNDNHFNDLIKKEYE